MTETNKEERSTAPGEFLAELASMQVIQDELAKRTREEVDRIIWFFFSKYRSSRLDDLVIRELRR